MGGFVAWLAAAAAAASPPPEAPARAAPEPAPAARQDAGSGVVRYDPSFFVSLRPNTAWDMILRLPGFSFDPGPQVRGFAGAAGNVLVDGDRPTTKEDNLQALLMRIPASQVDHIDLIRGGAPGIDMHGRTVLANVVRKSGSGTTGVIALVNTAFADGRQEPGVRLEYTHTEGHRRTEASLVASGFADDGAGDGVRVRTDADGNLLVRSNLDARAGGYNVTATAACEAPLWGGKARVNVLGFNQQYKDYEEDHLVVPVGLELLRFRQNTPKAEIGLHYEKALSPKLQLEALAIQKVRRNHVMSRFASSSELDLFDETDTAAESIARATLRYTASRKLSFETAAEGAFNTQTSDSAYSVDGAPIDLPAAHVTIQEKRGELSGLGTWRPSKVVNLEAGMRLEASQISSSGDVALTKTLFFPKPRAVLTLSPDKDDQVRLRVEREVGQLNFADFVASSKLGTGSGSVQVGNPDLVPQNDWAFEASYERHLKGAVLVLTYRRLQIQDVIDRAPVFSPDGVFDAPANIGSARENDIDANLTLPLSFLGLKGAQLKGQGTLRHSRVTDPTTGRERTITGQHRFDYELHFTQDLPKFRANWGIDLFGRWSEPYYRFSEIDVYKLKTYVAVFAEYKPRKDLSFRAELDNLGARGFERLLYVYNGPRNTSGLNYIDDRRQEFGRYIFLRVRKTFG